MREQPVGPRRRTGTRPSAAAVERAVAATLTDLDGMRVREGASLRVDLDGRQDGRGRHGGTCRRGWPRMARPALKARLDAARGRTVGGRVRRQGRLAQEVVRFAARSDISEEVVRFRAHTAQWAALSDAPEPCGRKLDFLLQEMNREINTMGSKADGVGVPELIVSAKAELEKMREQVQNVE